MIKTYLLKNPENITPQQLEQELLPALPLWRREQALKFKFHLGRVLCAKSFLLLKEGLERDFHITGPITFDYQEHGKPVIREHPEIFFNISHCNKGILCVIDDERPVGCDIEVIEREISDALLKRCCCQEEIKDIENALAPGCEFIKLWTKKEAVLKYTGEGINDQLPELLLQDRFSGLDMETVVCEEEGFIYTICR